MSAHRYTLQFDVTLRPERIDAKEWQAGLSERDFKGKLRQESLSFLLGSSRTGAHCLTLPNHPAMLPSTARTSAPTVVVSLLTEIHLNPPLTFENYPDQIASSDLLPLSPTSFTSPLNLTLRRTNRESRMQNP
jgi:hypothetical protein